MYSITHITVADFNVWKGVFDKLEEVRIKFGVVSTKVLQSEENSNEVFILLEWLETSKAKEYFASPELKEGMHEGGIQGAPDIMYFNEIQ